MKRINYALESSNFIENRVPTVMENPGKSGLGKLWKSHEK